MFGDKLFAFLADLSNYEERKVGRWDSEDGERFVSTCRVSDGALDYETAIAHPEYADGDVLVIEAYRTAELAAAGHERWVAAMRRDELPDPLTDVCNGESGRVAAEAGNCYTFRRNRRHLDA